MNNSEVNSFRKYFYKNMEEVITNKNCITLNDIYNIIDKYAASAVIDPETSNKIMACMGTYFDEKNETSSKETLTYDDNYNASYRKYVDIETNEVYKVPLTKIKEFESEYHVEYLPVNIYNLQEYNKKLKELKNKFFKKLLYYPQEDVVLKLKRKELN